MARKGSGNMDIAVLPECKIRLESMERDVSDIHDVVYKDGLVTDIALLKTKIDKVSSNIEKVTWMVVALVMAFMADLIGGLLLP